MAVRYPDVKRYTPSGQPPPKNRYIVYPQEGQQWPGLTKPDQYSRWFIQDTGADDLINYIPIVNGLRAIPGPSANIAALPSGTAIWMVAQILNQGVYNYVLSTTGHLYQISVSGAVVDCSTTTFLNPSCDITDWQGIRIIICDPIAQKVYSWDGTNFVTVFSSQPTQFIAVFSGRLWMSFNSTVTFTAGGTYNSLAGDSGNFTITDEDCCNPIIHLMSLAGQLWIFGSNWIQVLSNLQDITVGTVSQLTFTKYVLEAQVSIVNRWGIIPYGTTVYFPTSYGIYTIQGTQPIDVSENIGGFFQNLDPVNSSWSGAYGVIYGQPCMFWHVKYALEVGTTILALNISTGQWFRYQNGMITFVSGMVSSAITNSAPTVWGTDGTNIFRLFTNLLTPVTTEFDSKIWNFGNPIRYDQVKGIAIFVVLNSLAVFTIDLTDMDGQVLETIGATTVSTSILTLVNNTGGVLILVNNGGGVLTLVGTGTVVMYPFQIDSPYTQRMAGINLTITSTSHVLCYIVMEVEETEMYFGS